MKLTIKNMHVLKDTDMTLSYGHW